MPEGPRLVQLGSIAVLGAWDQGSDENAPGANELALLPVTPAVVLTVTGIGIMPQTASVGANFRGVIYADDGGAPGTLLASGPQVTGCAADIALNLPLTTPQTVTTDQYWIGYFTDTSVAIQSDNTGAQGEKAAVTYSAGAPSSAPTMTPAQPSWSIWGYCAAVPNGATAVSINADARVLGAAVAVTLATDYEMLDPPGWPSRPSFTGTATPQYPHTLLSGITVEVLACEAIALIAAGAATYA